VGLLESVLGSTAIVVGQGDRQVVEPQGYSVTRTPDSNAHRKLGLALTTEPSAIKSTKRRTLRQTSSRIRDSSSKGVSAMYIGGGAVVLIIVIVLIVFLVRR
jgi:hypothetical protein